MKKTITLFYSLLTISAFGQEIPTAEAQKIKAEGILLYKSEMASWHGTDLFLEKYTNRENVGGYFSYTEKDQAKCVFLSKTENQKIIGTVTFDSTYNLKKATVSIEERELTETELDLYEIRKLALAEIRTDTLFKTYNNTSLNLIPIINGKEKKVYVLSGPKISGVVIFGNDYLLTFDDDNKLLLKKQLHKNIIPIYYANEEGKQGEEAGVTMHSHLPETGDYITATDICTLMLYEKYAKWKQHIVVSEKYMNIWNCEEDILTVLPKGSFGNIIEEEEKKSKKERKKKD